MRWYWIVLLILPPLVAPFALPPFGQRLVTLVGIYALMGVGYQRVFGQLGGLNLAQGALFGVGAYAVALTAPTLGSLAFVVAALAAIVVAAIVAVPILRLQSHYFALATLALASLVNLVAVHAERITGGANGIVGFSASLPRGTTLLMGVWICLIAVVLVQAYFFADRRDEAARLIREAPLVAATLGIDVQRWRFAGFVSGAAAAGLAGGGAAAVSGVVSPDATGFPIMLLCLTSVVLGGARHPMGAVLGAAIAVCLPELFRELNGAWLLAYALATLAVILFAPQGIAGLIDPAPALPPPQMPDRLMPSTSGRHLVLRGVSKSFGGVEALSGVSFAVERGEIVGLIGPNGSGKTTVLNVISGLERADSGMIELDGRRLERLPAHVIARAGISRTFQTPLPGEGRLAGIARAVASGAAFLLFDEPLAGANAGEQAELVALLGHLRTASYGVLIVDHDTELLSKICDRMIALDRGRVVA
jgi:branched-chain amino acid transport system permease protein